MADFDYHQIIDGAKWLVGKTNIILMWLATFIGNYAQVPIENIYLILVVLLSLAVAKKIMDWFFVSTEGRTTMWLGVVVVIFLALKYL